MSAKLTEHPVHLGLGASVVPQPAFSGGAWYEAYAARHAADGAEGRLVSLHHFSADWDCWEMHPAGEELVVCVAGALTLIVEGGETTVLGVGDYAIVPRGAWHTADVAQPVSALFITAGQGTELRPR